MVVRFMSDTPYARLEQEMQHIPGFRPRKSGMIVSHLSDGSKIRTACVGIFRTGGIPFYKLMEVLAEEVAVSPLRGA